ncbi:hypothetical protein HN51_052054, partial [Arachis hypogaea]
MLHDFASEGCASYLTVMSMTTTSTSPVIGKSSVLSLSGCQISLLSHTRRKPYQNGHLQALVRVLALATVTADSDSPLE